MKHSAYRRVFPLLAGAILLHAITSCGGGGSDSTATTPTPPADTTVAGLKVAEQVSVVDAK
ncbi:hypothetical protein HNQ59_003238 [Chitinivorax tropicus]|uniref:Efflux transporter periplasmic adaptor subunit n=1 Tax=Chitinivorax tropicus TaxID=714531 RepID=A0A840MNC6_9PROT|nr:hypothetical protein [Chitinivorax tropicus]MBB5019930.1 hypothetical protein [Chitinivorax tropicus]